MEQTMTSKLQKTNKSMVQTWLITCRFQQMELKKKIQSPITCTEPDDKCPHKDNPLSFGFVM